MKQVTHSLTSGATEVVDVPPPTPSDGTLMIRTTASLISSGTERSLVEFGSSSWIRRVRQQPDRLKEVVAKLRSDGIVQTARSINNRLADPMPLGYCNVGTVIAVGPGVTGFRIGDRVASNGPHAEVISVPANLCATVPAAVSDELAAFTVLGATALQGLRLAAPTLGETVAVIGLGLVGQLAVQLLRAQGCRVLAIDFDVSRLEIASRQGALTINLSGGADPVTAAIGFTNGQGVDAVLIAAATKSVAPISYAARMSRPHGRIVLIGVAGLRLSRAEFYKKELTFQVSCSYGPGRYDPNYETYGRDYPIGHVRWTLQRNFEAVLDLMSDNRLNTKPLITHRFSLEDAPNAYRLLLSGEPSLGILLTYAPRPELTRIEPTTSLAGQSTRPGDGATPVVGFIGAGSYATSELIPAFKRSGAEVRLVTSRTGLRAHGVAKRFGISEAATDPDAVFRDPSIGAVVIATHHDSHAELVCRALDAGKHVFVEKPLALTIAELDRIGSRLTEADAPLLMIGFNRRFSPLVRSVKALTSHEKAPSAYVLTVNAGHLPDDHWAQHAETGGGRIIGEACHFIDLLRFLANSRITSYTATATPSKGHLPDTAIIQLSFANGSVGTVNYVSTGHRSYPKESLQIFGGGRVLNLNNHRTLAGYGWPGFNSKRLWQQDKGQRACVDAFIDAVRTGRTSPIPLNEILEVSRVTISIAETLRTATTSDR